MRAVVCAQCQVAMSWPWRDLLTADESLDEFVVAGGLGEEAPEGGGEGGAGEGGGSLGGLRGGGEPGDDLVRARRLPAVLLSCLGGVEMDGGGVELDWKRPGSTRSSPGKRRKALMAPLSPSARRPEPECTLQIKPSHFPHSLSCQRPTFSELQEEADTAACSSNEC